MVLTCPRSSSKLCRKKRLSFVLNNRGIISICSRLDNTHKGYKKSLGKILVYKARVDLGYSPKSYSGDIYYQLLKDLDRLGLKKER
jgi:hypothetical protein